MPPAISIPDAKAATKAFGRKTLLWDNYPVNDYASSAGRLLLAPYAKREAGLSSELTGILSNPMNQEAPSRVAVTGVLAFGWNDKGYDADRTWHYAARDLAGASPVRRPRCWSCSIPSIWPPPSAASPGRNRPRG
ncbi:beta-N-acetylglucosaminidase domain-containing protein [Sphingomonas sp. I4]